MLFPILRLLRYWGLRLLNNWWIVGAKLFGKFSYDESCLNTIIDIEYTSHLAWCCVVCDAWGERAKCTKNITVFVKKSDYARKILLCFIHILIILEEGCFCSRVKVRICTKGVFFILWFEHESKLTKGNVSPFVDLLILFLIFGYVDFALWLRHLPFKGCSELL